jgi:molybdopterin synthase catalytic subunit
MVRLQLEPIRAEELLATVRSEQAGAVVLFLGTVRDHNAGRRVESLEYEAYEEMARTELERLQAAAHERFRLSGVALAHRTGRLEVGEVAVGIAVASAHREEAFSACRFLIDSLKERVPIWKRERFEGGGTWIEGSGESGERSGPA